MSKTEQIITLEIDGQKVKAFKNETILQAARRNGFYIPTMCYLPKVKPIASCRMCVVDIDGMDAPVLSCQERVVEGIKVQTNSEELYKHRQNIMKLYDVNHPLQCGACPKCGECDLQNKTLEFNVGTQNFSAKDQRREIQDWGNVTYDPYLCIMCERCVRVSNEIVGDEALQISPGGYNSTIMNTKKEDLNVDWGECAAVCPVGALADKDFTYKANAWELTKIPASCVHSSLANLIYYEVKHGEFLRVRSDSDHDSISGLCRYGYDFQNDGSNCDSDMQKAVAAFKVSDTIAFTSMITNEEALILQRLKELHGYKLINQEALNYQKFLKAFSSTSGNSFYSGTSDGIIDSDYILVFGTKIATDSPGLKFRVNQSSKKHKSQVVYMHPLEDASIQNIVTQFMKYEVGSEDAVLALVAKAILNGAKLPESVSRFFDDLDDGYISAESNVGEEEIDIMVKKMAKKRRFSCIVGSDLYAHPNAENIAKILGLLEKYSDFEVTIIPPSVNTLGVSLICDLDEEAGQKVIGYNEVGDFILSAIEDKGDVNMPALNQQEGTFTNLNKKVVPTNVALPFNGFCLNDIANNLGLNKRYTIEYTELLPEAKGYKAEEFDKLPNYFDVLGEEFRGYELSSYSVETTNTLSEIDDIESFDGIVIYFSNPNNQKNIFTNLCEYLASDNDLIGSEQFAVAAKIKDGDNVKISVSGEEIVRQFKIDTKLKGTIGLLPTFDMGFSGQALKTGYRFNKAKIVQVNK
ncbi:MAG: (2Fe-2S)-binding protein [Epsilonproteobacteria bacterium]|nr:(2Fe-2S)-binding protein [Campylobacterota bacterium]